MPKVTDRRVDNAKELLKSVMDGPAIFDGRPKFKQMSEAYQLWARSWVIPNLVRLIPELRHLKDHYSNTYAFAWRNEPDAAGWWIRRIQFPDENSNTYELHKVFDVGNGLEVNFMGSVFPVNELGGEWRRQVNLD